MSIDAKEMSRFEWKSILHCLYLQNMGYGPFETTAELLEQVIEMRGVVLALDDLEILESQHNLANADTGVGINLCGSIAELTDFVQILIRSPHDSGKLHGGG